MSSLLERFCAPLCDHVLADRGTHLPGAAKTIARLHRENLFLVEIDAGGRPRDVGKRKGPPGVRLSLCVRHYANRRHLPLVDLRRAG